MDMGQIETVELSGMIPLICIANAIYNYKY